MTQTSDAHECVYEEPDYTAPYLCNPYAHGCNGIMYYERDEYGGIAGGGDYAVFRCERCGRVGYVELPD